MKSLAPSAIAVIVTLIVILLMVFYWAWETGSDLAVILFVVFVLCVYAYFISKALEPNKKVKGVTKVAKIDMDILEKEFQAGYTSGMNGNLAKPYSTGMNAAYAHAYANGWWEGNADRQVEVEKAAEEAMLKKLERDQLVKEIAALVIAATQSKGD